jgi:L-xylulose reductase
MEGKVALVTGASRGIGRQIVEDLVRKGKVKKIYCLCILANELEELKSQFPDHVVPHVIDITKWKEVESLIESISDNIELLVNNAGIIELLPVGSVTEDSFDRQFNVNVKAVLNISQCVTNRMIKNNIQGSIVNISSQASTSGIRDHVVYCSTKAAVDGITRVMALELGPYNIRVNSVQPTATMTCLGAQAWSDESKAKSLLQRIPLGRFALVPEVSNAVLFLLNNEVSSMITGTHLPVDGGFSIA